MFQLVFEDVQGRAMPTRIPDFQALLMQEHPYHSYFLQQHPIHSIDILTKSLWALAVCT